MNTVRVLQLIGFVCIALWAILLFVTATQMFDIYAEWGIRRQWISLPLLAISVICYAVANRLEKR